MERITPAREDDAEACRRTRIEEEGGGYPVYSYLAKDRIYDDDGWKKACTIDEDTCFEDIFLSNAHASSQ